MAAEKSLAIVLKVVEFSETSCIVTLFTRDFGKVVGLAKGARRRNGPFEHAIDLLAQVSVVFIHKNTDTLDLLTEAKLERRFRSAATDLARLNCGLYVIELLDLLTERGDPFPVLFDLAQKTLWDIDDGHSSPFQLLAEFELRMLALLGHAPSLGICVGCGVEISLGDREYFSPLAGGLYCSACRIGKKSVITLSRAAWESLDRLPEPTNADRVSESCGDNFSVFTTPRAAAEVREALNQFVSHLLGNRPRMQRFLRPGAASSNDRALPLRD